ncbi:MAG: serine/threonine protein kinase, partial [Planctomycetota bacterium]
MPARYEIRAELGRGGMGVVYRAFDRVLAREVALKRIRADWLDEEARKRFLREAELSARLAHPGIVRVHTLACGSAGELDLVLELVEGVSLAARLRSGSLAPGEAALLAENLARALAHAHARGVLHRDLKPSNVLLRAEDGAPTLTDFGLARELAEHRERLTRTGEVLGSPACMAPEQAAGELARVGPATDVYGLGAVLFAALTGRPPFAGKNLYSLLRQVLEAPPPRPSALVPSVPRALDAVCLRCLAKAPEDRYPTAAALAEDLARVRRGEPTRAEALAPESNRVASRRSLGAGLLATVLVGGACGALWLAGTAGPEGTPGAANSVRGRPPPPARTRPNGPRPRAARGSA